MRVTCKSGYGTFLSKDPFEGVMQRVMSRNGYTYIEGNPINYADPSGKFLLLGGIIGGVTGFFAGHFGAEFIGGWMYD